MLTAALPIALELVPVLHKEAAHQVAALLAALVQVQVLLPNIKAVRKEVRTSSSNAATAALVGHNRALVAAAATIATRLAIAVAAEQAAVLEAAVKAALTTAHQAHRAEAQGLVAHLDLHAAVPVVVPQAEAVHQVAVALQGAAAQEEDDKQHKLNEKRK